VRRLCEDEPNRPLASSAQEIKAVSLLFLDGRAIGENREIFEALTINCVVLARYAFAVDVRVEQSQGVGKRHGELASLGHLPVSTRWLENWLRRDV
jgi:hypothetical protein